jgi:hypothetical protein
VTASSAFFEITVRHALAPSSFTGIAGPPGNDLSTIRPDSALSDLDYVVVFWRRSTGP